MLMPIRVTRHARQRWDQRVRRRTGLTDVRAVARSAWKYGMVVRCRNAEEGMRRAYMGFHFVFKQGDDALTLVTVIPA